MQDFSVPLRCEWTSCAPRRAQTWFMKSQRPYPHWPCFSVRTPSSSAKSRAQPDGWCPVKVCYPGSAFCCVALSKWLGFSEPQVHPLQNRQRYLFQLRNVGTNRLGERSSETSTHLSVISRGGEALGDPPAAVFYPEGEPFAPEPPNSVI